MIRQREEKKESGVASTKPAAGKAQDGVSSANDNKPLPLAIPAQTPSLGRTLLQASWMAALLGMVNEGLILLLAKGVDAAIDGNTGLSDLLLKFSWSLIIWA